MEGVRRKPKLLVILGLKPLCFVAPRQVDNPKQRRGCVRGVLEGVHRASRADSRGAFAKDQEHEGDSVFDTLVLFFHEYSGRSCMYRLWNLRLALLCLRPACFSLMALDVLWTLKNVCRRAVQSYGVVKAEVQL